MNDHVVSRELAEKLKEARFPQETEFYWTHRHNTEECKWRLVSKRELERDSTGLSSKPYEYCSAPLATEILAWLPIEIDIDNKCCGLYFGITIHTLSGKVGYYVSYKHTDLEGKEIEVKRIVADTLPDALAEMAIYLKKEGLM